MVRLSARVLVAVIMISVILAQLLPPNIPVAARSPYPDLLLYAFKYRRNIKEEANWAGPFLATPLGADKGLIDNLAHKYILRPSRPHLSFLTPPPGTADKSWFPYSNTQESIDSPEELRQRAQRDYRAMCQLLAKSLSYRFTDVYQHNVSSDFYAYVLSHMDGSPIRFGLAGKIAWYLYFLDYVPLFVKKGDIYANLCLGKNAVEPPSLSAYVSVLKGNKTYVAAQSIAPLGTGADFVILYAAYLKEHYSKHPLRDAIWDLTGHQVDEGPFHDAFWKAFDWLKFNMYANTYLPVFVERGFVPNILYHSPLDDATIFTLVPSEIYRGPEKGIEYTFAMYNNSEHRLVPVGSIPYNVFAPIDVMYEGTIKEEYASLIQPREYEVTVWVEGPAMIAPARLSPDLSPFLPPGINYKYVDVTKWIEYNTIAVNTSLIRLSEGIKEIAEEFNRTLVIPSNLSSIKPPDAASRLETFYWILPDPNKVSRIYSFRYSTRTPEEAAESIKRATFFLIPNPIEGARLGGSVYLNIVIKDGENTWRKRVKVYLVKQFFDYMQYSDSYEFSDNTPLWAKVYDKDDLRTEAEVNGSISVWRKARLSMDWDLKGYVYGGKMYSVTVSEYLHDEIVLNAYVKGYHYDVDPHTYKVHLRTETRNLYYFKDNPLIEYKNYGFFDQHPVLKRDLEVHSTMTVILGGASPFPNWGAIPYWIPNLPSPLLYPSYTPTASGYLNMTKFPYDFPIIPELSTPLGDYMFNYGFESLHEGFEGERAYYATIYYIKEGGDPNLYHFGLTGRPGKLGFERLEDTLYSLIHGAAVPSAKEVGRVTFAPVMINHVKIRSTIRAGPIPNYVYDFHPEVLPPSGKRWIEVTVWTTDEDIPGALHLYNLWSEPEGEEVGELAVFTQFPTLKEYDLNLPFVSGINKTLDLDPEEFGWSGWSFDHTVTWPAGLTWIKIPLKHWAYGIGIPSVLLVRGNIHYPFLFSAPSAKRWSPILSYITPANGTLNGVPYCLTNRCVITFSYAMYNAWMPLGDGAQTIPLFYQVAVPLKHKIATSRIIAVDHSPNRVLTPGDNVSVKVTLFRVGEEESVTARLVMRLWGGVGNPFYEDLPMDIVLHKVGKWIYSGEVVLHVKSWEDLVKQNMTQYGYLTVVLGASYGGRFATDTLHLFLGEGLLVDIIDAGLMQAPPDPATGMPVASGESWYPGTGASPLMIFAERLYVVLSNETGEWVETFDQSYYEYSAGRFRVLIPGVDEGDYNVKVIMTLRYLDPFFYPEVYNKTSPPDEGLLTSSLAKAEALDLIDRENVTLLLGTMHYDPRKPEAVTIAFPLRDTSYALGILRRIHAGWMPSVWRSGKVGWWILVYYLNTPMRAGFFDILWQKHYKELTSAVDDIARVAEAIGADDSVMDAVNYFRRSGDFFCPTNNQWVTGCGTMIPYTFYSGGARELYQALLSKLEGGVEPMRVGEAFTNATSYLVYQVIDLITHLTEEIPQRVVSWGESAGYHLALSVISAKASLSPQSTAIPPTIHNNIPGLFEDRAGFLGTINALIPLTADAPAFSGMITRDTLAAADNITGPVIGGGGGIANLLNEFGDVLATWVWSSDYDINEELLISSLAYGSAAMFVYYLSLNSTLYRLANSLMNAPNTVPNYRSYWAALEGLNPQGEKDIDKALSRLYDLRKLGENGIEAVASTYDSVMGLGIDPEDPYTSLIKGGMHLLPYPATQGGSAFGMFPLNRFTGFSTSVDAAGEGQIAWVGDPLFPTATSSSTAVFRPVQAYSVGAAAYWLSADTAFSTVLSSAALSSLVIEQVSDYYGGGEGQFYEYSPSQLISEVDTFSYALSDTGIGLSSYINYYDSGRAFLEVVRELLSSSPRKLYIKTVIDWVELNTPTKLEASTAASGASGRLAEDVPTGNGVAQISTGVDVYVKLAKLSSMSRALIINIGRAVHDPRSFLTKEGMSEAAKYYVAATSLTAAADAVLAEYGRWLEVLESGGMSDPGYVEALIMTASSLYERAIAYELQTADILWAAGAQIPEVYPEDLAPMPYGVADTYGIKTAWPVLLAYVYNDTVNVSTDMRLNDESSVTFLSPGQKEACGTLIDLGEGQKSVDGECNYLISAGGREHSFLGRMRWDSPSFNRSINFVAYVRGANTGSYALAVTLSGEVLMTEAPKRVKSADESATLITRAFTGKGVALEPLPPNVMIDLQGGAVKVNMSVRVGEAPVKDVAIGLHLDLLAITSSIPSDYVLDLHNLELAGDGIEYRGMYAVRVVNGSPTDLYLLLNVKEIGNTSATLTIPIVEAYRLRGGGLYTAEGLTTISYGGTEMVVNSTGPATIEVGGNGSLIKLGITGSSADILIPASAGVPASLIINGVELPIEAELVTINGTEYYLIKASLGEIAIRLSAGGGGATVTTTETSTTSTTTASTTTPTTAQQTTTTYSPTGSTTAATAPPPPAGSAPMTYIALGVAAAAAAIAYVFWLKKKK